MEKESVEPSPQPTPVIKQLEYDTKSGQITRRQMRFFLLLLTINTILFAAFICLPTASPFLKKMLEDYQAQRDQKRMTAAAEAQQKSEAEKLRRLIDACMKYTAPADQVIYAEAPAEAAKLLAAVGRAYFADGSRIGNGQGGLFGGGGRGGVVGLFGGGAGGSGARHGGLIERVERNNERPALVKLWHPPVARQADEPLSSLYRALSDSPLAQINDENVVFLHEMSTPLGVKRLVWVALSTEPSLTNIAGDNDGSRQELNINRRLNAYVFDQDIAGAVPTSLVIQTPSTDDTILIISSTDNAELKQRGNWRIFAGQPDPANPSHLTIAYDIDGKPGVIDGWLKDGDRLMLEPRTGHLTTWNSGSEYVWDLSSTATTQPTK